MIYPEKTKGAGGKGGVGGSGSGGERNVIGPGKSKLGKKVLAVGEACVAIF